jgi:hypothetical protein
LTTTFVGHRQLALDRRDGVAGDVGVRSLVDIGQADLKVVRHPEDSGHALGVALRLPFVVVALDEPGQRDDAVLHRHPDVGRVDVRVPPDFILHVAFDLAVGPHPQVLLISECLCPALARDRPHSAAPA